MRRDSRFTQPELVRACAGAGKTYELSTRYIELLGSGEIPERILATTFTRKAAGEILDRIYQRLADAALNAESAKKLGQEIGRAPFASKDAARLLSALISSQHRLHIQTLDSFFASITRSFSLELGLSPSWRIESEATQKSLLRQAISNLCSGGKHRDVLEFIRLLSRREFSRSVHELIEEEIEDLLDIVDETPQLAWGAFSPPDSPEKGALADASRGIFDFEVPRTKKENKPHKRWSRAKQLLVEAISTEDWDELISQGLIENVRSGNLSFDKIAIPEELLKNIEVILKEVAARLLGRLKRQSEGTRDLLTLVHLEYLNLRNEKAMLFHSDLKRELSLGLKQAAWSGGLDELYYRLDSRLHHLLLDEFQDTSRVDWSVLYPIVEEVLSKAGPEHTFFCVGDTKQAIYGWRGGVAGIFNSIAENWPQVLSTSRDETYRLSPAVSETVNKVFSGLRDNPVLQRFGTVAESWSSRFAKHSTKRTDPIGYASFIEVSSESGRKALNLAVLSKIEELQNSNAEASIGVLVRSNKQISELMGALAESKFTFQVSEESGNPLTDSDAVNLLLSLLVFIDHPADKVARFYLERSALGDNPELAGLSIEPEQVSSRLRCTLGLKGFASFLQDWTQLLVSTGAESVTARDQRRLRALVERAFRFEVEAGSSFRLCDFVRLIQYERVEDPSAGTIRVMTIHQSKGLEFDAVILAGLDSDLTESRLGSVLVERQDELGPPTLVVRGDKSAIIELSPELAAVNQKRLETECLESLSLLYVAMTRAKHSLYMYSAKRSGDTFASLLRAALTSQELSTSRTKDASDGPTPGDELGISLTPLYTNGDNSWSRPSSAAPGSAGVLQTKVSKALTHSAAKVRSLSSRSPSQMEGTVGADFERGLGEFYRPLNSALRRRGAILHRFFEQLQFIEDGAPSEETLLGLKLEPEIMVSKEERARYIDQFKSLLSVPEIVELLQRARYRGYDDVSVERELPFAFREGEVLITGKIDRIVICKRAGKIIYAEILDFKSDHFDRSGVPEVPGKALDQWMEEKKRYYKPQLELYAKATEHLFGLERRNCAMTLVFVAVGRGVSI